MKFCKQVLKKEKKWKRNRMWGGNKYLFFLSK